MPRPGRDAGGRSAPIAGCLVWTAPEHILDGTMAKDTHQHLMPARDCRWDEILDSVADAVVTIDDQWRITSFNRAAEEITGVPREEAIGSQCSEILRSEVCDEQCPVRQAMAAEGEVSYRVKQIVNADGARVSVSISAALLRDDDGKVIGGVEILRDITAMEALRKELEQRYTFNDIISHNHRMRELFDILPEVAASDSTVLIQGESGTGKELVARAIHNLSPRSASPLVVVNCGALPDTLLEAELFGYKAGAFTDAKKDKPGRFALADGGTIFLDEIGDVSPAMQTRLLRVLQEKTYEPLGGVESVKADVRVITATNRDLGALVAEDKFRQDLYYRINVMQLSLPPLKDRKEDIPILVDHFVARFNRLQDKTVLGVADSVLKCLMMYDWPGNIRELENSVEHAFILCRTGLIEMRHLPLHLRSELCESYAGGSDGVSTLEDMERLFISESLRRNEWNRRRTAEQLGIDRGTLRRKIKSLGIVPPPGETDDG